MWRVVVFWTLLTTAAFGGEHLSIQSWWLRDLDVRQQGMQEYLKVHYGPNPPRELIPRMVVVHWTGATTAKSTWNTFGSATLKGRRDIQSAGDVNVSAHFLVDQDGTIYQLLPENHFARHCIGVNHLAIGIENVGGTKSLPLTSEQVAANAALIRDLRTRHEIDVVIGHYEIKDFETHPFFVEQDPTYRSIKTDPGLDFMQRLRAEMVRSHPAMIPKPSPDSDLNK